MDTRLLAHTTRRCLQVRFCTANTAKRELTSADSGCVACMPQHSSGGTCMRREQVAIKGWDTGLHVTATQS